MKFIKTYKKALFFIFIFFTPFFSQAQKYKTIPDSGASWYVYDIWCQYSATNPNCASYDYLTTSGKVVRRHDTVYHVISKDTQDIALFRSDTTGKTYIKYLPSIDPHKKYDTLEHLLFDMNLKEGDSVSLYYAGDFSHTPGVYDTFLNKFFYVSTVDSVVLKNGELRKHINLYLKDRPLHTLPCINRMEFIEGIGTSFGPVYAYSVRYGCFENGYRLDCFSQNNEKLLGACWCSIDNRIQKPSLNIFPNPANDKIFIEGNSKKDLKAVSITDINGRTIIYKELSLGNFEIDIHHLPIGTYIVKAMMSDGNILIQKLIKN